MQEKRGLSSVVTTLIIILLALVVVGVVWVSVNSFIDSGVEEIELGKFTLDLEIKSVKVDGDNVTVTVVVRRNPGKGNLIGMNFVFSDGTESEIIKENTSLKELEEKTFTFTLTKVSGNNLKDVSVAPIYELSSGKEDAGNVADSFDIPKGVSLGAGSSGGGGGSASGGGNFEALGHLGVGKVEYGISAEEGLLPEFRQATVDPLDVLPGFNQTFTVDVYSPNNIVNVTSVTELDNSISNLIFLKVSEYVEDSETIEIWDVTWNVTDVHSITYRTNITAEDSVGNKNSIVLTWSDACQGLLVHGTNDNISQNCGTGTGDVTGLDGGTLTIDSGSTLTMDPNSILVFNSGEAIIVQGTIATISSGAQIKRGDLYYHDKDGDGYSPNATLLLDVTSNTVRAMSLLGSPGDDCYDPNGDAKPGQTVWFQFDRGDGSFDYNCVSGEQKQLTATSGACKVCATNEGEGVCDPFITGAVGWTGSSPACGSSGTYVSNIGDSCASRVAGPACASTSTCVSGATTQGCH